MNSRLVLFAVGALACAWAAIAVAGPDRAQPGQAAHDFTLPDLDGTEHSLSAFKDKTVVLEWFNPGCPFVKHAHGEGPLSDQAARHKDDVVWIAINSGARGKQGYGVEVNKKAVKDWSLDHLVLLDETGSVGRLYGAATTPHMFVIDRGIVRYQGALDNAPLGRVKGDAVQNYVDAALADLAAGREVARSSTKPYGCSVKYGK
jgi:peroxiredoxin